MNTPSHHRVHHATNPQYLDMNFAGIFIVWDKLFGTFVEEQEDVTNDGSRQTSADIKKAFYARRSEKMARNSDAP